MQQHIYLEGTNQRAIILCHAYTGSTSDVRLLATQLNKKGYAVYLPLYFGHGTKDLRNVLQYHPEDWVDQTQEAIEAMIDRGFERIAIFGLSMGGMMALNMLTKNIPQIIGGGSFNSPVPLEDYSNVLKAFMGYADNLYTEEMGDRQAYDADLFSRGEEQLKRLQMLTYTVAEHFNKINVPVYIAQSGKDALIDVKIGQLMANALPFTTVDFNYFEDATHVITVGEHRQLFNDTVCRFIDGLGW